MVHFSFNFQLSTVNCQLFRLLYRFVDIATDILGTEQFVEAGFLEGGMHLLVHAREDDVYLLLLRHLAEVREVVDARRVDEGDAPHPDDAYLRAVSQLRHHLFKLRGNAEEVGAVDFVHFHALGEHEVLFVHFEVGFEVRVDFVADDGNLGRLHHALQEEDAGNQQPYLDGDGQIEDDREEEGDEQHRHVRLRVPQKRLERPPPAHIIRNHHQHARQASHRDILREGHQEGQYQQQHEGMDDTRDGRPSAIVDVRHRAGDRPGGRNPPEDGRYDVGHALRDQLGVRVMPVAYHAIRHRGREERFDRPQDGYRHRHGEQTLDGLPIQRRHRRPGELGLDAEAVAYRVDLRHPGVHLEEIHAHGHHDNRHQRTRHLLRKQRREGNDRDAQHAHPGVPPIHRIEMPRVEHPLPDEIARDRLPPEAQPEDVGNLRGEDRHRNTARKPDDDGIGDELDDRPQPEDAQRDEHHARQERRHHQPLDAILLDNPVNNHDKRTRRPAYLHLAPAQKRDEETRHNGRNDTLLRTHARGDAKGDGQGQRHNPHDDPRHQVRHKVCSRISL